MEKLENQRPIRSRKLCVPMHNIIKTTRNEHNTSVDNKLTEIRRLAEKCLILFQQWTKDVETEFENDGLPIYLTDIEAIIAAEKIADMKEDDDIAGLAFLASTFSPSDLMNAWCLPYIDEEEEEEGDLMHEFTRLQTEENVAAICRQIRRIMCSPNDQKSDDDVKNDKLSKIRDYVENHFNEHGPCELIKNVLDMLNA